MLIVFLVSRFRPRKETRVVSLSMYGFQMPALFSLKAGEEVIFSLSEWYGSFFLQMVS